VRQLETPPPRKKRKDTQSEPTEPFLEDKEVLCNHLSASAGAVAFQVTWSLLSSVSVEIVYHEDSTSNTASISSPFSSSSPPSPTWIQTIVDSRSSAFEKKFDNVYELTANKGFSNDERKVGARALSAMLGGIGHFYGKPQIGDAIVVDELLDGTENSANLNIRSSRSLSLLSATPSRTAFPRGFLWDEGFHQMLIVSWDSRITMKVIVDWLSSMHFLSTSVGELCQGGWIPREMILGEESRSRVPDEFITQRPDTANPPTLLLAVERLLDSLSQDGCSDGDEKLSSDINACADSDHEKLDFLRHIFPSLNTWVTWFLSSQQGPVPGSFRWRGRSASVDNKKLAVNTLASGLDDYPRSLYPSHDEQHVDLLCWMITATRIMGKIRTSLDRAGLAEGLSLGPELGTETFQQLSERLIVSLDTHWSESDSVYVDIGLRQEGTGIIISEAVVRCAEAPADGSSEIAPGSNMVDYTLDAATVQSILSEAQRSKFPPVGLCPSAYPLLAGVHGDGRGGLLQLKVHRSVINPQPPIELGGVSHIGYVNIFPLLLRILPSDSLRLGSLLDVISDPELLWTNHGLRSISSKDTFYMQPNAEGDNPYWRGPIWININYLALSALHHYSNHTGPYQSRARDLYKLLRENILTTVGGEYLRSGFFWEQYDDTTGRGMRNKPFSGWTALVLNILSEQY